MKEIQKQFNFKEREVGIYKLWEESGFFNPDNIGSDEKYSDILPPPNANGELHLGHAGGYTVMDIFGRYQRMTGKKVLLLPGKDHAGIQTQVVFERKLKEEKGISRHELGRDEFYKETYAFCIDRAGFMRAQEKRIGISADWSREKFTLDPAVSEIAIDTFIKMYEDGMIYRGSRIINWCPRCGTALSDIEVIHKEQSGKLYFIKYPLKNSSEFIVVATTRPETMLGDAAIAVNPKDKRFEKLVGKSVILPLLNREIPIIADDRIDMDFGTGAVKITPAHDPLDYQIGKDHKLEEIQVIDERAEITIEGGKYAGQNVTEARKNILSDLAELNLLEKEEDLAINLSQCERCKTAIEPLISKQWFVNMDAEKYSLKKESIKAIEEGRIKFYPENFKGIMLGWFNNLQDWCVSRQIWWGHRIPAWKREAEGREEIYVGKVAPGGEGWIQEEDTFDTWFSSGQWPYTTLGFSDGKDYKEFYPTDTMVMGRDLLFFWASRMIMFGLYKTGEVPFKNLYFTGLVRDKFGQKMSKSRGNGIDPLEMIEKYGADAVRLSLVMDIAPGQDFRVYEEKIESFRNFVTKLWNIFRYCAQSDDNFKIIGKIYPKNIKSLADHWIVSELEETKKAVGEFMENKEISLAKARLRRFTWDQLADWYVERNKYEKNSIVLGYVLGEILKMWHPFTPFVTEEIWSIMHSGENLLMIEKWPEAQNEFINQEVGKNFSELTDLIIRIRNIRSNYHISPSEVLNVFGEFPAEDKNIVETHGKVKFEKEKSGKKMIAITAGKKILELDIADQIDIKKELDRIDAEIINLEKQLEKNQSLLDNKKFAESAPAEIISQTKIRISEYEEKISVQKGLKEDLKRLE